MRPEGTVTLQTVSKQQNYPMAKPKPSHQLVWPVMVPFAIQVCAHWKGTFTLSFIAGEIQKYKSDFVNKLYIDKFLFKLFRMWEEYPLIIVFPLAALQVCRPWK